MVMILENLNSSFNIMSELKFAENTAREGEGLNDAGIETYRDDPYPAIARETSQNSRDADRFKGDPKKPVRLVFRRFEIRADQLPDLAAYKQAAKDCLSIAKEQKNIKETAFFEQAVSILDKNSIPVLEIADYNTKGLKGPCEEGTPFHALVKSSGSSNKEDSTSGGSFGIGKSAVYSASDLQTVYYSTVYNDEAGKEVFLCQGKTKFRSHETNGTHNRSVAYWGNPNGYNPIDKAEEAPEWARRDEIGTSVFSIAVRDTDDWVNKLIASIIVNFFGAINAGTMEFEVNGTKIDKNNLSELFENEKVRDQATLDEDFMFAAHALECLNSADATTEMINIPGVGQFRLRILILSGLPKRVGLLRNGMMVCQSMKHFGDSFARFPMYQDFIALVEPVPIDGSNENMASAWVKNLENPRHDELSPERLITSEERGNAKRSGKYLAEQIRNTIRKEAQKPRGNRIALDELAEFFSGNQPREEDKLGNRSLTTFKIGKVAKRKKREVKAADPEKVGNEGGSATEHKKGNSSGSSDGGGSGQGSGGTGAQGEGSTITLNHPRTMIPDGKDSKYRLIFFTPEQSGRANLMISSPGISNPELLNLSGKAKSIDITCNAGERFSVEIEFAEPYDGPIEVTALTPTTKTA